MIINTIFIRSILLNKVIPLALFILFAFSTAAPIQNMVEMAAENDPKLKDGLVMTCAATLFTNFIAIFLWILRMFRIQKIAENKKR